MKVTRMTDDEFVSLSCVTCSNKFQVSMEHQKKGFWRENTYVMDVEGEELLENVNDRFSCPYCNADRSLVLVEVHKEKIISPMEAFALGQAKCHHLMDEGEFGVAWSFIDRLKTEVMDLTCDLLNRVLNPLKDDAWSKYRAKLAHDEEEKERKHREEFHNDLRDAHPDLYNELMSEYPDGLKCIADECGGRPFYCYYPGENGPRCLKFFDTIQGLHRHTLAYHSSERYSHKPLDEDSITKILDQYPTIELSVSDSGKFHIPGKHGSGEGVSGWLIGEYFWSRNVFTGAFTSQWFDLCKRCFKKNGYESYLTPAKNPP